MFFFDDVNDKRYFFKQFLAGVFTVIAMNGLDQDMMQRNLSCKNFRDSQKNMITSGISQFFVILLLSLIHISQAAEKHGTGEAGCDTEKKARGETANTPEARIADFRAKIADRKASSGKEYLSFYFMEANSYEVE